MMSILLDIATNLVSDTPVKDTYVTLIATIITGVITVLGVLGAARYSYLAKVKTVTTATELKSDFNLMKSDIAELRTDVNSVIEVVSHTNKIVNVKKKLNDITIEALRYVSDNKLIDYILLKSNAIINLVDDFLMYDINTLDEDAIDLRINATRECVERKGIILLNEAFITTMHNLTNTQLYTTKNSLLELIADDRNDKMHRFSVIVEKFLKENIKITIKEFNNLH